MIWSNKGHQYGTVSKQVHGIKTIYLYGAAKQGAATLHLIEILGIDKDVDAIFVDGIIKRRDEIFNGRKVIYVRDFFGILNPEESIVVITIATAGDIVNSALREPLARSSRATGTVKQSHQHASRASDV